MKINKNIWTGKNKPYNRNSLYFPDGIDSGETAPAPPSGGESGGSTIEYLDVSGLNVFLAGFLASVGVNVKWDSLGSVDHHPIVIAPTGVIGLPRKEDGYTPNANILAVAVDKTIVMYDRLFGETPMSVGDFIEANDIDLASIPRLTKEQFYTLD